MTLRPAATYFGRLLAVHPDVQLPEYWLEARKYAIGRIPDLCDIVIQRSTVSRVHAELEGRGAHFLLRDLLSSNGTYIDGKRIEGEHILRHGQKIGLSSPEPVLDFADAQPTLLTAPANITPELSNRLHYDEALMIFFLNGQPLRLTQHEFRCLSYLFRNQERVCKREELAEAVWQHEYASDMAADNLDKVLFHLRKEIRRVDPEVDLIKLYRSIGYRLEW